jgi:hypothetical protein
MYNGNLYNTGQTTVSQPSEDQPGVDRSDMEASAVEANGNSGRPCSGYTRHPVDVGRSEGTLHPYNQRAWKHSLEAF